MLKIVKGDLVAMALRGEFDAILHGCNCQNTMGSGVAVQIKNAFPGAYEADTQYHRDNKLVTPGNYSKYYSKEERVLVYNLYTQYHYLPRGIDHFDYEAFEWILMSLSSELRHYRVGLPMIGCGLAGGNPKIILPIIEQFAAAVYKDGGQVTLVEYGS